MEEVYKVKTRKSLRNVGILMHIYVDNLTQIITTTYAIADKLPLLGVYMPSL